MKMKFEEFRNIIREDLRLPEPLDEGFATRAKAGFIPAEPKVARRFGWTRFTSIAASAMAAFSLFFLLFLGTQVRTTVSLDVNPSLSLKVNYFNRVIDVEALNADGEAIVAALDIRSGSISRVMEEIFQEAQELDVLTPGTTAYLLFGVAGSNFEVEQQVETLVREALAEAQVETLFLNKHEEADDDKIYSGLVIASQNALDSLFESAAERDQFTTTAVMTTTSFSIPDFSEFPAGSWDPDENMTYYSAYVDMSEEEFATLAEMYGITEAKLQLAITVFHEIPGYSLESDLAFLCHLSIENLYVLYSAVD